MPHEHRIVSETTRAEGLPLKSLQLVDEMSADNWSLSHAYAVADQITSGIRHYFILRRQIGGNGIEQVSTVTIKSDGVIAIQAPAVTLASDKAKHGKHR